MTEPPCAAIRVDAAGLNGWLVARTPTASWTTLSSAEALASSLPEALQTLRAASGGVVIGLLPYPAGGAHDDSSTPARVMLFEQYETMPALPDPGRSTFSLTTRFSPDSNRENYVDGVRKVLDYLTAGDAYQVNLAQRFSAQFTGCIWPEFVRVSRLLAPPCAAWLALGDRQVLSFSPESFLSGNAREVETRPIKGTRPRGKTGAEDARLALDLATHPKDRAENLMIVDLLRNDLGRACQPGSVHVPELFRVESFQNVHHLVSTVRGTLASGQSFAGLLQACFPGGSITGAPKKRATEIIAELEPHPRDIYCGSIFWITADGRFGSNILIRTFLAHDGRLTGWAGAGIVADSRPDAEYQECLDKLQSIMNLFDVNNQG